MNDTRPESVFGSWRAPFFIGVALFALAATLYINAGGLRSAGTMGVGPSAALRLVSVALIALGLAHWVQAFKLRRFAPRPTAPVNVPALAWCTGGWIAAIACVAFNGGFILAATLMFVASARAFGKPVGITSIAIGLVLSTVASLFFTQLLSLSLPEGLVEAVLYRAAD